MPTIRQCNTDSHPCSRCRRLGIPCVGLGEQRYKFKNETLKPTIVNTVTATGRTPSSREQVLALQPARSPSNDATRSMSLFVNSISSDVDIRFQLPWNFGPYLKDIPRHLGTSKALDAATNALAAAHRHFCVQGFNANRDVLTKHSRALSALRHDLEDTVKAKSTETLCAVMVLMITQV